MNNYQANKKIELHNQFEFEMKEYTKDQPYWKREEKKEKRVSFKIRCLMCADRKSVDEFNYTTMTMSQVNCPVCTGERK